MDICYVLSCDFDNNSDLTFDATAGSDYAALFPISVISCFGEAFPKASFSRR